MEMTDLQIVSELTKTRCRCGCKKERGRTFCFKCYYALPKDDRHDLYRPVGKGYVEAYRSAESILDEAGRARVSPETFPCPNPSCSGTVKNLKCDGCGKKLPF